MSVNIGIFFLTVGSPIRKTNRDDERDVLHQINFAKRVSSHGTTDRVISSAGKPTEVDYSVCTGDDRPKTAGTTAHYRRSE
jgi:hypothetical protein